MTIDQKTRTYQQRYSTPEYKKVTVRWKEGHIRDSIKSSTHQVDDSQRGKIIISHKFSRRGESSEPHVRLPSLGVCHQEEESSEHSAFKARGLDCELCRHGGNRNSTPGGCTQSLVHSRTWAAAVASEECETKLPDGLGASPG